MKKIILIFSLFFINFISVGAEEIKVKFNDCVDGDTAKFVYKKEIITARFLAVDTPETVHPTKGVEEYGKEASDYTCNTLKKANEIVLEYDNDSDKTDKYDRHLVWVFVDGELLQENLVSKGLASVAYLYGDYKYTEKLEVAEQEAEENKLGIWDIDENNESAKNQSKNTDEEKKEESTSTKDYKEIIMLLGIVILLCIFSSKARKKVKNKVKKEIKKRL